MRLSTTSAWGALHAPLARAKLRRVRSTVLFAFLGVFGVGRSTRELLGGSGLWGSAALQGSMHLREGDNASSLVVSNPKVVAKKSVKLLKHHEYAFSHGEVRLGF